MVSRSAYAAGLTGILANCYLIALYFLLGLQSGNPSGGSFPVWFVSLGRNLGASRG